MAEDTLRLGDPAAPGMPWHPALNVLWAKTGKAMDGSTVSHPLTCHLLDVAAVSTALWETVLPEKTRRLFRNAFGLDDKATGRFLAILAGFHDFGKASPAFQIQNSVRQSLPNIRAHLVAVGLSCPEIPGDAKHGEITAHLLNDSLEDSGVPPKMAKRLAEVVGGHHGIFAATLDRPPIESRGGESWRDARRALYSSVESIIGGLPRLQHPRDLADGEAVVLAGLVCVADWIGSNTEFFPYEETPPADSHALSTYWDRARLQARVATERLGWLNRPSTRVTEPLQILFPEIKEPYPIQSLVASSVPRGRGPALMIVEAPMGEGKTEAALYAAETLAADQGYEGFYFALPTQATSNQMLSRVRTFLQATFSDEPVQLQLLHGKSVLQPEFFQLRDEFRAAQSQFNSIADDEADACGTVVAAEWFSRRKQGLLSPYAVGTVDQALMAALPVRHFFVRLLGLSQKVVIIDEVHAYDTYMTELMERLLEWLAAVGTSVVLLSATLPRSRTAKLIQAFRKGLSPAAGVADLQRVRYPRLAVATLEGVEQASADAARRSYVTISLDWLDSST